MRLVRTGVSRTLAWHPSHLTSSGYSDFTACRATTTQLFGCHWCDTNHRDSLTQQSARKREPLLSEDRSGEQYFERRWRTNGECWLISFPVSASNGLIFIPLRYFALQLDPSQLSPNATITFTNLNPSNKYIVVARSHVGLESSKPVTKNTTTGRAAIFVCSTSHAWNARSKHFGPFPLLWCAITFFNIDVYVLEYWLRSVNSCVELKTKFFSFFS